MTTPTTSPPTTTPPGTAPALTTTFTPSPACVVNIYRFNATDSSGREQKQFFDHLGPIYSTSTCLPSNWLPGSSAFFSPGVYCPVGYEVACTSEISLGGETETRGTCCPRGYGCQTETGYSWYATDLCSVLSERTGVFVYTTSTPGLGLATVTTTGRYGFNAFGIQMRWRAADLAPATGTPSTSGHASPGGETQRGAGGLGMGAGVGIGVCVTIGVLLVLAAVGYFAWFRRRRAAGLRQTVVSSPRELSAQQVMPELWAHPPEIGSRQK